ncbi:MAG: 5'-nucleotidase C-terminal domain-containing protein, partial [Rubrivivax sp.]|nr:5'-nucleotidase C-terminal domain-containing protein [Pyrinomonadaceae bacterium]
VTDAIEDDPAFAPVTAKYNSRLTELSALVGKTTIALDARSATSRSEETNIADFIADAFRREGGADFALMNGGSIRADEVIEPGDLTLRDVLSILPFGGDLVKIEVTGDTLVKALEHGLGLTAPGAEPGRFPQVSGLRYSFDASRLPGVRLIDVTTADGKPIDPKKTYTLVTTAFVAGGGDGYAMLKGHANLLKDKLTDSDVLRRAISTAKTIAPRTDGRIRRLDRPAEAQPCKAAAAAGDR